MSKDSSKPVCECHKIDWEDRRDGTFHFKDGGKPVDQETAPDCQAKVNRGEMTLDEYFEVCQNIPSRKQPNDEAAEENDDVWEMEYIDEEWNYKEKEEKFPLSTVNE